MKIEIGPPTSIMLMVKTPQPKPLPFTSKLNLRIRMMMVNAFQTDGSPFHGHRERTQQVNPARWKATWEDIFVAASEVLREGERHDD